MFAITCKFYKKNNYSTNLHKIYLVYSGVRYLVAEGSSFLSVNLNLDSSDIPYISYYVSADSQLYLTHKQDTNWLTDTIQLYGFKVKKKRIKSAIAPNNKSYFLYYSDSLLKLSWKDDYDTCKYCIIDTIPNITSSDFSIDNEGKFHAIIMSETEDYKTVYYYTADSILNSYPITPKPDTQPDVITDFLFNISPLVTNQYINIQYELPSPSNILYKIYDSMGRIIKNISEELGALKHEGFFEFGIYQNPKVYLLSKNGKIKTACKGVPEKKHFNYILNGSAEYRKPVKLNSFLYHTFLQKLQKIVSPLFYQKI